MMVSVCVGVVRTHTIGFLIESVRRQTYRDWEMIVVCQGLDSDEEAGVARIAATDPRMTVIRDEARGKSNALNLAVSQAQGDILAFTDDDCEATPDWLAVIADCFEREPEVGLVAGDTHAPPSAPGRISTCPATRTIECIYRPADPPCGAPPGFYWGGANYAIRRTVYDLVGPFDPYLGSGSHFRGANDVDYALRTEAARVPMWTTPRAVVRHTYGRRIGLNAVLRLKRIYATGSGAVAGKLHLWGHRLADEWSRPPKPSVRAALMLRSPARALLDAYAWPAHQAAFREYVRDFVLDDHHVTRPRAQQPHPERSTEASRARNACRHLDIGLARMDSRTRQ